MLGAQAGKMGSQIFGSVHAGFTQVLPENFDASSQEVEQRG